MERYRPYDGRRRASRRRRSASREGYDGASRQGTKLIACVVIFAAAAVVKLVFPSFFAEVGDRINSVVNYRAALSSLGEGISGEKKFTQALSEALVYAFGGERADLSGAEAEKQGDRASDAAGSAASEAPAAASDGTSSSPAAASPEKGEFSNAVVAAFLQSQEEYSDYAIPAGATYDMPRIDIPYTSPVNGVVSSSFGYREHPEDGEVRFHYGTDIAAKEGSEVVAFADGKVIAAGESQTLGKYVVISHGNGVQTQYAHCGDVYVSSGQAVKKGERIASVGKTGNATEPCLHFELKVSGIYVNPEYYVRWT